MTKFHINKKGVPAPCRATEGNCPLGGEGQHFDTEEKAQMFINEKNEKLHGLIPELENNNYHSENRIRERFPTLNDNQVYTLKNYVDKEIEIKNEIESLKKERI